MTVLLYVMNWFKITICNYFSYQCLNFMRFAMTVPRVLLWCYQQNYYNLWRVHISSMNKSAPTSLLQSINSNLMMNTENQSLFKANYCVFKSQTINYSLPKLKRAPYKITFFCHGYFEEKWMYPFLIVGTRYPTLHTAQCIPPLEVKLQDLVTLVWKNSTLMAGVLTLYFSW